MDISNGLSWRYQNYIRPSLMLHEHVLGAATRKYNNFVLKRTYAPTCYLFADASNIGDRVSAEGVKSLVGEPGIELFTARAGLNTTFPMLKWLQENRPQTRIIIGGGGLLQECFVPFWTELLKTKLPFVLFGIGANEMPGKRKLPPHNLLENLAHRAHAIHVRDKWTQGMLQFGQESPVSMGICPSINYLVSKFKSHSQQERTYLLHVQHPVDVRMAGGDPVKLSMIMKAVAADLNLIYDETDHIKEDLNGLAKRYQRAKYVVSSRLHGCIFSYAFGVPFVPIVSDKKTAAFIDTHIPENPSVDVRCANDEIKEKLLAAEKLHRESSELKYDSALSNNVSVMDNIIKSYSGMG